MQDDEQRDLDKLKTLINDAKIKAIDYQFHLSRLDATQLSHCGYKSIGEALIDVIKRTKKELDAATAAFYKKYPDER